MNSELASAIKILLAKITADSKSHDDLHISQAALNLAHVAQVKAQVNK